ncbi:nitroreductase family protein [Intestinibacillus massiliensis]|nr:nitroreductase family protein [Intestinibacillus massiliensis]
MDYSAMSQARKSVRAFWDTPVPALTVDEIETYFGRCKRLVPSIDVQMRIFERDVKEKLEGTAGYQGFMIGAPCYMVILSDEADHYIENAGFIAEDMILKMTELELSSCWITFSDGEEVKKALGIESDKRIGAIIAFGYGQRTSKKIRLNIKSMSNIDINVEREYYSPKLSIDELVHIQKWGGKSTIEDIGDTDSALWRALYAASLSPSYLNRQPYGFILDNGKVILVVKKDEHTDEVNEKLNIGIVMLHFSGVISQMLFNVDWHWGAPEQDLGLPADCSAVAYCLV